MQAGIKALTSRICGTSGGIGSRLHTEESGQAGEESAGKESEPDDSVLEFEIRHNGEDKRQHDKDDCYYFVLLFEIRHGSLTYMGSNGLHELRAFILAQHRAIEIIGK